MGNLELFWDFHFGILDAKQPTPNRIRSYFFSSFPCRATPAAHEGASRAPSEYRKTRSCLILERFSDISPSSLISTYSLASRCTYPVSSGGAAIRATMLPNSRLVR
jgi:hypothetical protein